MATGLHELPSIGSPAKRALTNAGYASLGQLSGVARADLARLHGVGPKALRMIEVELDRHGLRLT